MDKYIGDDLKFIWHPYTQARDLKRNPPILIEKAKGVKLYDNKGNFYYDTISSWWCNIHGHNHPLIKKAIKSQLDSLEHVLFAGFTHKPAIELAKRVAKLSPSGLRRVFFSDDGSTAVEVALKMSFQYWQNKGKKEKKEFISLNCAYHGDTIGAMSVSGVDLFNKVFSPLFFKSHKAPPPYCYRCFAHKKYPQCNLYCLSKMEELLKRQAQKICAVIIEPLLMAAGGMIIYSPEYLKGLEALTKKYNVHLIADEVATGFGRTGKMFASDVANISPDFMCLSKGITSGYLPLGITLTKEPIYRNFYADCKAKRTFYHGHTYTANPLACAAALATLDIFEEEKVLKYVKKIMPLFHRYMDNFRQFPWAGDVRYIGMVGAIEIVKSKKGKKSFSPNDRIGYKIYTESLKKNILLRPLGDIIYFFLPLCVKERELKDIMVRAQFVLKNTLGKFF